MSESSTFGLQNGPLIPEQAPTNAEKGGPADSADTTTNHIAGLVPEAGKNPSDDPSSPLQPLVPPQPRRKIDLSAVVLPEPGKMAAVEMLEVRELKGPGAFFTPNLDGTLMFQGLVYKPQDEFDTYYQLIAGNLQNDPRVLAKATRIAFVPAFSWSTFEMFVLPKKLSSHGRRVLDQLQTLKSRFPGFKTFIDWDPTKKRHVVFEENLSAQEQGIIAGVTWPTKEKVIEALEVTAFDNIDDLMASNDEIRALVYSKKVE